LAGITKCRTYLEEGACITDYFSPVTNLQTLKLTKVVIEQSEVKRASFLYEIGQYKPEQLVFVDESSFDKHTTYCEYGWSLCGECATK